VYGEMVETFPQEAMEVIRMMNPEFTSHDFIRTYIMRYTSSYLSGLYEYHDVQELHAVIGRWLSNHAEDNDIRIRYVEHRDSMNIFGKLDKIAVWQQL